MIHPRVSDNSPITHTHTHWLTLARKKNTYYFWKRVIAFQRDFFSIDFKILIFCWVRYKSTWESIRKREQKFLSYFVCFFSSLLYEYRKLFSAGASKRVYSRAKIKKSILRHFCWCAKHAMEERPVLKVDSLGFQPLFSPSVDPLWRLGWSCSRALYGPCTSHAGKAWLTSAETPRR